MSKVNLCWEILAARIIHAENDRKKVEKWTTSCTHHNQKVIFISKIFGGYYFVQHYQVHRYYQQTPGILEIPTCRGAGGGI